jgi:hypothetical protein
MPLSRIKTTNMSEGVVMLDASAADTDVGERLLLDGTDGSATDAGFAVLSEPHTASMTGRQDDPAGTILQIVKASNDNNEYVTINSSSFSDTGCSVRIFPKRLDSLFVVNWNSHVGSGGTSRYARFALYRSVNGATAVQLNTDQMFGGFGNSTAGLPYGKSPNIYVDQPVPGSYTLGQYIDYQVYAKESNGDTNFTFGWFSAGNSPEAHIAGGNGFSGSIMEVERGATSFGGNASTSHNAFYGDI